MIGARIDMNTSIKIVEIDGELGVVLPLDAVRALKARAGDTLTLAQLPEGILISPLSAEELRQLEIARRVMKEHRGALAELAKR
jgi:hypothetical protein